MRAVLLVIFYLIPFLCRSQNGHIELRINSGGTYIVAYLYKEGILVGSDSRVVTFSTSGKIALYHEDQAKVYQVKNIVVAMAGQYCFDSNSICFKGLLKNFTQSQSLKITVRNFYEEFMKYAKRNLSKQDYEAIRKNKFLVSGYYSDRPSVYYYNGNELDSLISPGYKSNFKSVNKNIGNQMIEMLKQASETEAINSMKALIETTVKNLNRDTVSIVGGSPSIISIHKNKIYWIQRNDRNTYSTTKEFANAYKQGLVKIWYRSKNDSIAYRKLILPYAN